MKLRVNFDEDFDVLDDVETVYFTPAGATKSVRVENAFRHAVTVREAATSGGAYSIRDTAFNVKRCDLPVAPEAGSLLSTACGDELFYIFGVDRILNGTQFRLYGRRGYLQSDLKDVAQVKKNAGGKDKYGAPYKAWVPYLQDHPVKVQEVDNTVSGDQDRSIIYREAQIYTLATKDIDAGMRIEVRGGLNWNVLSVTGKGELGLLVVLDCVEARTPGA